MPPTNVLAVPLISFNDSLYFDVNLPRLNTLFICPTLILTNPATYRFFDTKFERKIESIKFGPTTDFKISVLPLIPAVIMSPSLITFCIIYGLSTYDRIHVIPDTYISLNLLLIFNTLILLCLLH